MSAAGRTCARCGGVDGPGVWIGFGGDESDPLLDETLGRISADVASGGRRAVLLLGRYRHLEPEMRRLAGEHPDLDLSYRTVHAAKGLEGDYVVVVGLCAGRYGVPTVITDDPLLQLVLAGREAHPKRGGAAAALRCRDARQAARVPPGGGRAPVGVRGGASERGRRDRGSSGRRSKPTRPVPSDGRGGWCPGRARTRAASTAARTTPSSYDGSAAGGKTESTRSQSLSAGTRLAPLLREYESRPAASPPPTSRD